MWRLSPPLAAALRRAAHVSPTVAARAATHTPLASPPRPRTTPHTLPLWRGFAAESASEAASPSRRPRTLRSSLRAYSQLAKARLSALVVATAAAGYVAGSDENVDWAGCAAASAGTALCAASANALNQVYEIRTDALMTRTAARPLPSGRLTRGAAIAFAAVAAVGGVATLAVSAPTPLAATLGAANIGLYAAIYTPLKRVHPAATWVGAVVGAIPPLIGWAAAAGELQPGAAILAAGLYFWQLPHFMALAWLCRVDYARGGHKMLSLVDPTGSRTARCALRNSLYLLPLGFAAVALGTTTPPFGTESAIATGVLATAAAAFAAKPGDAGARLLFRASLLHLPAWMAAFLVHRVPNTAAVRRDQAPAALAARWRAALEPQPRLQRPPAPLPGPLLLPPVLGVGLMGRRCPSAAACEEKE